MSFRFHKKKRDQNSKIGNTESLCALGHSHRSKLESSVCQILQLRAKAGEIEILQVEDHVYLSAARIGYIADFRCKYVKTDEVFLVEAKGYANDRWPLKKKLYKFYGEFPLEIWTGSYQNPQLTETIIPKKGEK